MKLHKYFTTKPLHREKIYYGFSIASCMKFSTEYKWCKNDRNEKRNIILKAIIIGPTMLHELF